MSAHPDGPRGMIRKRKDPEPLDPPLKPSSFLKPALPLKPIHSAQQPNHINTNNTTINNSITINNSNNNKLLAGYLAHEFLTKGSVLGKRFDSSRAELAGETKVGSFYSEIAYLLKSDGTHIAGVVNPSQLAKWVQR